jgi:hypothetical protein
VRLASQALQHGIAGKWKSVEQTLRRLGAECDSGGLATALVALCDTFAEHANDGMPEFGKVHMASWCIDTGAVGTPPRPSVQWALDLIQARAGGDRAAFSALLETLNTKDGFERGRYVLELIESVALTIRSLPRGYARMGRDAA